MTGQILTASIPFIFALLASWSGMASKPILDRYRESLAPLGVEAADRMLSLSSAIIMPFVAAGNMLAHIVEYMIAGEDINQSSFVPLIMSILWIVLSLFVAIRLIAYDTLSRSTFPWMLGLKVPVGLWIVGTAGVLVPWWIAIVFIMR